MMDADDLIHALVMGDRDVVEDAEEVSSRGLTIEAHHEEDGAKVVLSYDPTSGWRCDDAETEELDLFDIHELVGGSPAD